VCGDFFCIMVTTFKRIIRRSENFAKDLQVIILNFNKLFFYEVTVFLIVFKMFNV
jgi:hypothetical protein